MVNTSTSTFNYNECIHGTLDPYTNAFLYNKYREAQYNGKYIEDFIGYVDKDVEDLIKKESNNV